jgi:predicted CXXCH cytochrome family protein
MFRRWLLIVEIAALLVVSGCSPETRYHTLSFFFDGVPDPAALNADTAGGDEPGTRDTAGKPRFRNHGPYAAKLCEACHLPGGGRLIMPVEELCINCHALNIRKKHVHGPVASGGCRVCHHPHGSGKPFLLASEPTSFCFFCHDKDEVGTRQAHKDAQGVQCTECHDPHSSDNNFMLRFANEAP